MTDSFLVVFLLCHCLHPRLIHPVTPQRGALTPGFSASRSPASLSLSCLPCPPLLVPPGPSPPSPQAWVPGHSPPERTHAAHADARGDERRGPGVGHTREVLATRPGALQRGGGGGGGSGARGGGRGGSLQGRWWPGRPEWSSAMQGGASWRSAVGSPSPVLAQVGHPASG